MPLKVFCKTCNIFGLNCYVLVLIAIGLTILFTSCASFEHLTMVTEETFPQAGQCGKCHVEIYHEWSNSDHSTAYTNPDFRRTPKTSRWCALCQRDFDEESKFKVHLVDSVLILHPKDKHLYDPTKDGEDYGAQPIGPCCAKRIGLEWVKKETKNDH